MKTLRNIIRAGALSAILLSTSCTSSDSATVDEIVDESSDNQISSQEPEEAPASPDIPSPADVSKEVAGASGTMADSGSVDSGSPTSIQDLPQDQQGVDSINQAEDNSVSGLSSGSLDQVSPDVPPPPSLSEIVGDQEPMGSDNETPDALSPAPEKKVKNHGKKIRKNKKAKMQDASRSTQGSGDSKVYIVQPGDTLGSIARVIYGSSRRWHSIARTNQLSHSTRIYPGDMLRYDADADSSSFDAEWQSLPQSSVSVRKSDTLSSIAARIMGNSQYWKLIWRWNEDTLSNPHRISPGTQLKYVKPQDLTAFLTERKNRELAH